MEDGKILALLWERAENAIDVISRRFGKRLYVTAMNILNSRRDAEESVNDTYLAVWNAIPPKRPDPLAGFVYKTGRNQALKRLRDETRMKRRPEFEISMEELEGCIPAPALEETVEARELGETIDRFLDTIPQRSRDIFLRRYWFGDSVKSIGSAFAMNPNTVSVLLSRLREQLREYLKKEGYWYE